MSGWEKDAACAQVDPELFFPEKSRAVTAKHAKEVCAACPVLEKCRERAMADVSLYGIWGGMTRKDRMVARTKVRESGVTAMAEASRARAYKQAVKIMRLRNAGQEPAAIAEKLDICIETVYRAKARLEKAELVEARAAA